MLLLIVPILFSLVDHVTLPIAAFKIQMCEWMFRVLSVLCKDVLDLYLTSSIFEF